MGVAINYSLINLRYPRNTFNNTQNADPQSHPQPDTGQRRTHFRAVPDRNSPHLATTALQRTAGLNTSGEERLSGFLLWQCAYSELYFCDTLWPDFDEAELDRAIAAYQQRDRRFGGVKK